MSEGTKDYDGYAKLQPGDYLDNFYSHVRLVVENNPSAQRIKYLDQTPYELGASNNMVGTHEGSTDYSSLLSDGYAPMYVNYPMPSGTAINSETFPDTVFRSYVRDNFDTNKDGCLNDAEIAAVTTIQVAETDIKDLTGIKLFTNLDWLECNNCKITKLDLSGMKNLGSLWCWSNGMTSLNLRGCTKLTELWAYDNKLTDINLKECTNLKKIYIWVNTGFEGLKLSDMPNLEGLWAAGCTSMNTLYIKNNPKMTELYVDNCTALERIEAKGSGQLKLSSSSLVGSTKLYIFNRDSGVKVPGEQPVITDYSFPETAYVGEKYSAYVRASGTKPLSYYISSITHGWGEYFTCDQETGDVTATPSSTGDIKVTIKAYNYVGGAKKTFNISVIERKTPEITTKALPGGKVGEAYSAQLEAKNAAEESQMWFASGLPSGLKINAATGALTGIPTAAGSYTFTVTVVSNGMDSEPKQFTLTIAGSNNDDDTPEIPITVEQPEFRNFSIMMEGQIGMNFYVYIPDDSYTPENCWMEFNVRGDTAHTPQPLDYTFTRTVNGVKLYGFRCYINAGQMADTITATLHYGNGQTITKDYSAKTYLDTALATPGFSQVIKNLMTAIKNFGHYVQPMLSKERGWVIGEKYLFMEAQTEFTDDDINNAKQEVKSYAITRNLKGFGISDVKFSLTMGSETTINLYIFHASGYSGGIAAYIDGSSQNNAVIDGTRYKVQISNISAKNLGDMHTIKIAADAESTIKISALSYADTILSSTLQQIGKVDIDTMRKAAAALYNYYKTARAYADSR